MYIPELLYLSYHRRHRFVTHQFKCNSYQGCLVILVGFRIDGNLKSAVGFFLFVVLKIGDL